MKNFVKSILGAFLFCTIAFPSFAVTAKLCIDPGHGGSDPGAVGCGDEEANHNLAICLRFRDWLNADTNDAGGGGSWTNVMVRTTDVFISLQGRCDISNNNGCNRFMSTHNNACCNATGTETFSYSGSGTAATLRNQVQQRILNAWGLTNRGNKTYGFYVLVNTAAPAILLEGGFTDRCDIDAPIMKSAAGRDSNGKGQMFGIQTHYGLAAYTPGSNPGLPTYTLDNNQSGFAASANWSTGTSAADKFGADYRFRSTAAISDRASWTITVGTAGTYRVQAWWSAGTNRAPSADFELPNGAGVAVNQQANGGKWNVLGSVSLAAGARTTYLSCWEATGFVVVADAVRYGP